MKSFLRWLWIPVLCILKEKREREGEREEREMKIHKNNCFLYLLENSEMIKFTKTVFEMTACTNRKNPSKIISTLYYFSKATCKINMLPFFADGKDMYCFRMHNFIV